MYNREVGGTLQIKTVCEVSLLYICDELSAEFRLLKERRSGL
jgi:hypothetical protein